MDGIKVLLTPYFREMVVLLANVTHEHSSKWDKMAHLAVFLDRDDCINMSNSGSIRERRLRLSQPRLVGNLHVWPFRVFGFGKPDLGGMNS
jgi:hypothetical protein